ncbi:MAG: hypothetical protein AAGA08_12105 [Pseudomonadota bacterium]
MYISLSKMIFDAQRKAQDPPVAEPYEPRARGEVRSARAARKDSVSYRPVIQTYW